MKISLKIEEIFRRATTFITLISLIVTSFPPFVQASSAASSVPVAIIPAAAGKITDARIFDGDSLAVVIQDLHCHPEVQKNINTILASLDRACGIKNIYLEGASGDLDTSWLNSTIRDKSFRNRIVNALMDGGELTGPEYFSYFSGKYRIILGLENETLYDDTIERLAKIHQHNGIISEAVTAAEKEIRRLQATYLGRENQRLERLSRDHARGKIDTRKYYSILFKQGRKAGIDVDSFRNITGFLSLSGSMKQLNYRRMSIELNGLLSHLRNRLPYKTYRELASLTGEWQNTGALYSLLPRIAKEHGLDLQKEFPYLAEFLSYNRVSESVNPITLVKEERKLLWMLQHESSRRESEKEVVFIGNAFKEYREFLLGSISSDDYRYFQSNYNRFLKLWNLYSDNKYLAPMETYRGLLQSYYQGNIQRNEWFVKNSFPAPCEGEGRVRGKCPQSITIPTSSSFPANSPYPLFIQKRGGNGEGIGMAIETLSHAKNIVVTVTGGFHTPGYTELLAKNGISYIVVTPNVTQDTRFSDVVYRRRIKEQARVLFRSVRPNDKGTFSAVPFAFIPSECANVKALSVHPEDSGKSRMLWAAIHEMGKYRPRESIAQDINRKLAGCSISIDKVSFKIWQNDTLKGTYSLGTGNLIETGNAEGAPDTEKSGGLLPGAKAIEALRKANAVARSLYEAVYGQSIVEPRPGDVAVKEVLGSITGSRLVTFGLNAAELIDGLLLAKKNTPDFILGEFLQNYDHAAVPKLIEKKIVTESISYGTALIKGSLSKMLGRYGRDLGIDLQQTEIAVLQIDNEKLVQHDKCLLVSLGISPSDDNGVRFAPLIVHEAFIQYLRNCEYQGQRLPKEFNNIQEFIDTAMEHEVLEFIACNRPDTELGRAFTRYLSNSILRSKTTGKTGWEKTVEKEVLPFRTPDNFHDFIKHVEAPGRHLSFLDARQKIVEQALVKEKDRVLDVVTQGDALNNSTHPFVAVFDLHGVLLKTTWKEELAYAYMRARGSVVMNKALMEAGLQWVEENLIGLTFEQTIIKISESTGRSAEEIEKIVSEETKEYRGNNHPAIIPGAEELLRKLQENNVPVVITSGSSRQEIIGQLNSSGLMKYISEECIVGRDTVPSAPEKAGSNGKIFRGVVVEDLQKHFPGRRIVFFNDATDGFDKAKELGGISVGVVTGKTEKEQAINHSHHIDGGADYLFRSLLAVWLEIANKLSWNRRTVRDMSVQNGRVSLVLPSRRTNDDILLNEEVRSDMQVTSYSQIRDAMVFDDNGRVNYDDLNDRENRQLLVQLAFDKDPKKDSYRNASALKSLLDTGKRFVTFRGITVSLDAENDGDVPPFTAETLFMHQIMVDSGLLNAVKPLSAAEIGTECGYLSAFLADYVKDLKNLVVIGRSIDALRLARRSLMYYLERRNVPVETRSYTGNDIRALENNSQDLIIVNPSIMTDMQNGPAVIGRIFLSGVEKLNRENPQASIIIPVSAAMKESFDMMVKSYGSIIKAEPVQIVGQEDISRPFEVYRITGRHIQQKDDENKNVVSRFLAFGVNGNDIYRSLRTTAPLLAEFLYEPSVITASAMKGMKIDGKDVLTEWAMSPGMKAAIESAVERRVDELEGAGVNIDRANMHVFALDHPALTGKDRNIYGRININPDTGEVAVYWNKEILTAMAGEDARFGAFETMEEFIGAFINFELDSFLAMFYPQSKAGKGFNEYLYKTYGISEEKAESRKSRTIYRLHEWFTRSKLSRHAKLIEAAVGKRFDIDEVDRERYKELLSRVDVTLSAVIVDMDGTLLQPDEKEISHYMLKALRHTLEDGMPVAIVSASSYQDIYNKVLSRMIEELGTEERKHLLSHVIVAANNGGQIYEWDADLGRFKPNHVDAMESEQVTAGHDALNEFIDKKMPQLIEDYKYIRGPEDDSSPARSMMIEDVSIEGKVNQITFFPILKEPHVTRDQKTKYRDDCRRLEKYAEEINEKLANTGLVAIVSGSSRIMVVQKNVRKSNAIKNIRSIIAKRQKQTEFSGTCLYIGDKFKWVGNGNDSRESLDMTDDMRDASVVTEFTKPGQMIIVNVGKEINRPEGVKNKNYILFNTKGPVGAWLCLDRLHNWRKLKARAVPEDILRPLVNVLPSFKDLARNAALSLVADESKAWTGQNAREAYGKTVYHYFGIDWTKEDMRRVAAFTDYGMPGVAFISYIPATDEFNSETKLEMKIPVKRDGKTIEMQVTFGTISDGRSHEVPAVYLEEMRPEEVFAIAAVIKESGQIQKSLGMAMDASVPDIVDFHCQALPGMFMNGYDFAGREIAEKAAIVMRLAGYEQNYLPSEEARLPGALRMAEAPEFGEEEMESLVHSTILKYDSLLLRKNGNGVTRPQASVGTITGIANLRTKANRPIGEFTDLLEACKDYEIVQLLPFFTPEKGGDELYAMKHLMAADIALVHLDDVEYDNEVENGRIDREEVISRKIKVLRQAFLMLDKDQERKNMFLDFVKKNDNADTRYRLSRYANDMGRKDVQVYYYAQWLLSQQIKKAVQDRYKDNGKQTYFALDINKENAEEALLALSYWFSMGFHGVNVRVADEDCYMVGGKALTLEQLCAEIIKSRADATYPGAVICARLPESVPVTKYAEYEFKRIRYYSELAPGEQPGPNDVIHVDPPGIAPRPYMQKEAVIDDWQRILERIAEKVRPAGQVFFAIGDFEGDEEPVSADYRIPLDGDPSERRCKPFSAGFGEKIVYAIKSYIRHDADSVYQEAFNKGYGLAKGIRFKDIEGQLLNKRQEVRYHDQRGIKNSVTVYENFERGLHAFVTLYEKDPGAIMDNDMRREFNNFRNLIELIEGLGQKEHRYASERNLWHDTAAQLKLIKSDYGLADKAGNDEEKTVLAAECAGLLRGINEAMIESRKMFNADMYAPEDARLLRPLYALAISRGIRPADINIEINGTSLFDKIVKYYEKEEENKNTGGIFHALAQVEKVKNSVSISTKEREIRIRKIFLEEKLLDECVREILSKGVLPDKVKKDLQSLTNYQEAYSTVILALIQTFKTMVDDRKITIDTRRKKELMEVYKAVLQAA